MSAYSYAWSRAKDDGHIIKSAVSKNPMLQNTLTPWLYVLQNRSYGRSKFYSAEIGISTFLLMRL